MLPAFLTAICFALSAVSARQSSSLIGPFRANFFRLLVAVLILGLIAGLSWHGIPMRLLLEFTLAGGVGFGLGGFCMMQALKLLGSPKALLTVESGTAVLAGMFSWVVLDDKMTLQQVFSCGIILSAVLYAGSTWIREHPARRQDTIKGNLFAGASALFQSTSLVLSRHAFLGAQDLGVNVDVFNAAFVRLLGGLAIALLLVTVNFLLIHKRDSLNTAIATPSLTKTTSLTARPIIWIIANATFGPVLGVTCWLWAVSLLNPGIVQSIAATAPLISIPISRKLESNPLGTPFFIGAPVAILGITMLVMW